MRKVLRGDVVAGKHDSRKPTTEACAYHGASSVNPCRERSRAIGEETATSALGVIFGVCLLGSPIEMILSRFLGHARKIRRVIS